MSLGFSTVNLANKVLNHLTGNATWTAPSALYIKLHKGDPGAAGTANASAVTTRVVATFAAASGGSVALNGTAPHWAMTATETITHISVWDAASGGNFLFSAKLNVQKSVVNLDGITLNAQTLKFAATSLAT